MIKILNRREIGNLFHYAHFICDCLFPEIVTNIYKNKRIIREKSISQTLGNFLPNYCLVMNCKCVELEPAIFDSISTKLFINKAKEDLTHPIYFKIFRTYIFNRFNISPFIFYPKYPSVLLIQRGKRVKLINDVSLQANNLNYTNGAERREINNIENVKSFMKNKFGEHFKTLFLEHIPLQQQIQYFNNATIIVCAHGACMSNLFFCKKDTLLFEVTCGEIWKFFDVITKNLQIIHHKIEDNNSESIIQKIEKETVSFNHAPTETFDETFIENAILKRGIMNQRKNIPKKNIPKKNIPKKNIHKNKTSFPKEFLYTTGSNFF
jgi:hypothetical protein